MTCTQKGDPQSSISIDIFAERGFCCGKEDATFVLTCRGITGLTTDLIKPELQLPKFKANP